MLHCNEMRARSYGQSVCTIGPVIELWMQYARSQWKPQESTTLVLALRTRSRLCIHLLSDWKLHLIVAVYRVQPLDNLPRESRSIQHIWVESGSIVPNITWYVEKTVEKFGSLDLSRVTGRSRSSCPVTRFCDRCQVLLSQTLVCGLV